MGWGGGGGGGWIRKERGLDQGGRGWGGWMGGGGGGKWLDWWKGGLIWLDGGGWGWIGGKGVEVVGLGGRVD